MVPLGAAPTLVNEIRGLVSVVTGTRTLGASPQWTFSMLDRPLASHNINYDHSWLLDSVVAQEKLLDKIVDFYASAFGGAHSAFRLMITCAVRRCGILLRTLPLDVCRPYLATADSALRVDIFLYSVFR
jgi:hypothetical protein